MGKDDNILYWLWLSEKLGAGANYFSLFGDGFDSPFEIYSMTEDEIEHLEGVSSRMKDRLCDKSLENAYSVLKYCKSSRIDILTYYSSEYPERLKDIPNPPMVLYCKGKLPKIDTKLCIAMVGTRKMSEYGKQTAYRISYELAASNVCIVSGMAAGIDGVCACGALEAGGETVAVLGCGLARVYPREHAKLMAHIAKKGAVISEYPPFAPPCAEHFPMRNRIISGLCQGTVVVEAASRSGALITASKAMAQGRDVFAVPGKVDSASSKGANGLIRDGARIMLSASDILCHYDFLYYACINYAGLAKAKKRSEIKASVLSYYGVVDTAESEAVPLTETATGKAEATEKITSAANNRTNVRKDENVGAAPTKAPDLTGLDPTARRVYELMDEGVCAPDVIASKGIDIGDVVTALTLLEIAGLATSLPGGMFKKIT